MPYAKLEVTNLNAFRGYLNAEKQRMLDNRNGRDGSKMEVCVTQNKQSKWPLWTPSHPGCHFTIIPTCKVCILILLLHMMALRLRDALRTGTDECIGRGMDLGHFLGDIAD